MLNPGFAFLHVSVCPSVCLSVGMYVHVYLAEFMSACVCPYGCMLVRLYVCVRVTRVPASMYVWMDGRMD